MQTALGLTAYPMDTRGFFPRVKAPRRKADHSTPYSAKDKNGGVSLLQQFMIRKGKTWVKMENMWREAITA
jgi:hypothetical protein